MRLPSVKVKALTEEVEVNRIRTARPKDSKDKINPKNREQN